MGDVFYMQEFQDQNDNIRHILVGLDVWSHYMWACPLKSTSAAEGLRGTKIILERSILTLKRYIYRYIAETDHVRYIDKLQHFVSIYNNHFHRFLNMTPKDAEEKKNQKKKKKAPEKKKKKKKKKS